MERKIIFDIDNYYHVYNRGVAKMQIFHHHSDYKHFQRQLFIRNSSVRIDSARVKGEPFHTIDRGETLVDILAYAIMPNHFHLLLYEKKETGISSFMNKLSTAYSMYFNTKYERSGPLLCRPFRAKHVDTDEYLRWLFSYIHNNPVEIVGSNNLAKYQYSSYPDYLQPRSEESQILALDAASLPFDASILEETEPKPPKARLFT